MRDRLIELLKGNLPNHENSVAWWSDEHIGAYADMLIANGVIVPPCKVGDTVWAIRDYKGVKHPQQGVVSEMFFTRDMKLMIVVKMIARGHWGKTVFLTKEEAEQALRGES